MTERCFIKKTIEEPKFIPGKEYFGQRSISIAAELECSAASSCILNKLNKSHVDLNLKRETYHPDYSHLTEKQAEQMPAIKGAMEYSANGTYFEDEFTARVEQEQEKMSFLCEEIRKIRGAK